MKRRALLELIRGGQVVREVVVDETPVRIGRDLSNTVSLLDDDVSTHHAVVAWSPIGLEVRDLRSTNGTFVGDQRIDSSQLLHDQETLRLGATATFRVRLQVHRDRPTLTLEHRNAGVAHLIDDERFRIGATEGANLSLPSDSDASATLVVHADGEVWLGTESGERCLEEGEEFQVGDHRFAVVPLHTAAPSTVWGCKEARYDYLLRTGFDASGRATASLHDPKHGVSHTIASENRATLLYILARGLDADRAAGRPTDEQGWTDDDAVLVAVWGRAGFQNAASTYSVLLHRLRKEIEDAGFDPWFIEKRRGAARLRLKRLEWTSAGEGVGPV